MRKRGIAALVGRIGDAVKGLISKYSVIRASIARHGSSSISGLRFVGNAPLDFALTSAFRWTFAVAAAFVLGIVLLLGFVYWQSAVYLISQNDALLAQQIRVFAANTPERRLQEIDDRLDKDPQHIKIAALFGADGHRIAGNMESLIPGLMSDVLTTAVVARLDGRRREMQNVRLIAHWLPDGDVIVIGQNIDEIHEIAQIVRRTLALGLLPALGLAVGIGMVMSRRAYNRLSEVNGRIKRIVEGDLHQRLPTRGGGDAFDQLAFSVNRMLDDIEALLHETANTGENIAHDLRTPLTRVRIRLERGRERASTLEESRAVTDQAIAGLDQSLATITALLRIAEIEHSRRLDGFGQVKLADLLSEVADLYGPIAEDKHISLEVEATDETTIHGDRDLLFEAVANLVDNALKFTPEGGRVKLALLRRRGESVVRISDTGPGIPELEREAVTRRFYRSDKSRNTKGLGLGLSLVAAIVKLHGFRFGIAAGPGCTVEIACPRKN
jgi:signal transduction histidine kinase